MLNRDFREFIASLDANGVRYLVIGGYAVAFHGHPRYTKDLDVWIDPDSANVARLLEALRDFGFASLGLTTDDFADPEQVVQLGFPPVRIDLFTSAVGVEFAECYAKRLTETIDGTPVAFIDRQSLLVNKRASGRHQDLADVENLEE